MRLSTKEIVEKVTLIAKPIVESMGFELFDVKYKSQGGKWILSIVIDKLDGYISTQDCERVSYQIEKELDNSDIMPGRYFLEVASPGLDRPLRNIEDFERFKGSLAKVKAGKTYTGYIVSVEKDKDTILLEVNGEVVEIKYSDVKSANLEVEF
ncbi:MAG: ribosome maturation factor RimP [Fervidobacterium sp.]